MSELSTKSKKKMLKAFLQEERIPFLSELLASFVSLATLYELNISLPSFRVDISRELTFSW